MFGRFEIEMKFCPCTRLNDGRCGWWYAVAPSIYLLLLFFGLLFLPLCGRTAVRSSAECRAARSIIDPLLWAEARNVRQAHAKVSTYIPNTQIYVYAVNSCWFPPPVSTCIVVSCIDVDLPFKLSWSLWLLLVPHLPCKPFQDLRLSKIQPVHIKNSVPYGERTAFAFSRLLFLYRETIAVWRENHSKHLNTLRGQSEISWAVAGGMYNYHRTLKLKVLYSSGFIFYWIRAHWQVSEKLLRSRT